MNLRPPTEVPRLLSGLRFFYLVLVCIFSVTAFKLTSKSLQANERYSQIINTTVLQADALIKTQKHAGDMQNSLTQMLFNSSEEDMEDELQKISNLRRELDAKWASLGNVLSSLDMRDEYVRLLNLHLKKDVAMNAVIEANRNSPLQNDSAVRLYYEKELPAYQSFEDQLRNISIKLTGSSQEQQESLKEAIASGVLEINAWLLGCLVTIIVGTVVISRHHSKLVNAQAETAEARKLNYEQASRLTIRAQEEERNRISKELHDNVGQLLSVLKLNIELAEKDPHPVALLGGIRERVNRAIHEIRTISHSLGNPITSDITLNECVEGLIDSLRKATPEITYNVYLDYSDQERYMNPEIKINLYRIFQEVMTNSLRHAEATVIEIRLLYEADTVTLIVHDNGKGFNAAKARNGIGMSNIYNRAQAFEGTVSFESQPDHGCLVSVQLPFQVSKQRTIQAED